MAIHTLKRRDGSWYRYSLTFADSKTIALLEVAEHEPTRKIAVVDVTHLDELQELCDKWNEANEQEARKWSPYLDPPER